MITSLLAIIICSWTLPKIVPKSHWLKYYMYYGITILSCFSVCILMTPVILLLPWRYSKRCGVMVARIISKIIGIEWIPRNENIWENHGHGIIVANHQTIFDALGLVMVALHLGESVAVTKKEIFYIWPLGLLCSLIGCIFVDRSNPKSAVISLNSAADAHFKRYHNGRIIIFPEGTRNRSSSNLLLPFKKGAFRMAIDRQIPIFPIVFSPYYFINDGTFDNGKILISFLGPIQSETNESIETLMEKTRTAMQNEVNKLRIEIQSEKRDLWNERNKTTNIFA